MNTARTAITRSFSVVGVALAVASSPLRAQDFNPVNLFVADLRHDGGLVRLSAPRKLTADRSIYSQPSFTPDGTAIVFARRDGSADAQTDVFRIHLGTGTETQITRTAEMENSPTITPDGRLMVIRWVPATLFREWGPWLYGLDGIPLKGVLPGPDTVGYYARIDSVTYAVMRPKALSSVALFDARSGLTVDLDGPSANLPPQRIPGQRAISFTRTDSHGRNQIRRVDIESRQSSAIAPTVPGRTMHVWTPHGILLMAKGNTVFAMNPARDLVWYPVTSFASPELQNLTTYVISPAGDRVILISSARVPLHVALRDSVQAGSGGARAAAALKRIRESGLLSSYEVSEGALRGVAAEQMTTGRVADGVEVLIALADLFPRSYRVPMELGDAYLKLNDLQKAQAAYRRSLDLNPRATEADRTAAERVEKQFVSIPRKEPQS